MTRQASPSPPREDSDASVPETVRKEAADIAASAAERAGQVTGVVGEQAKAVASETGRQARQLLAQGMSTLRGQAREGQQKVVGGLRNLADQLHSMSERGETGMASDVVRQVSERASSAASWLESCEPGDLVEELRNLARRRPGIFLAGAAFAGVLAGRLTRNMVTAGPPSATEPGYAPPVGPAEPDSVTTASSGHPGTGSDRS